MVKPANSNSDQLSLELTSKQQEIQKTDFEDNNSSISFFVDARTTKIRREAIERVSTGGIFEVKNQPLK